MNHIRTVVALAAACSMAVGGVAGAAAKAKPKPVCDLITDVAGDGNPSTDAELFPLDLSPAPVVVNKPAGVPNEQVGPSNDALDVLSADIAADKKFVSVAIRVKKLALTAPTASPSGIHWEFGFTAEEIPFTIAAHTDAQGTTSFDAAYTDPIKGGQLYGGGVTGTFDLAKNEIRMTAPTDLFAGQATIKPGKKLSALTVRTGAEAAIVDKTGKVVDGALLEVYPFSDDRASSTKTYVVGTKSCLTPGK